MTDPAVRRDGTGWTGKVRRNPVLASVVVAAGVSLLVALGLGVRWSVPAVTTVEDLADDGIFETDEELTEFLKFVRERRNASLA